MADESRRFSRIPFKVKAELHVQEQHYTTDELSNLSVGGCLLPVSATLDPGAPCNIRIRLEGTTEDMSLQVDGEIVRCDADGVAVKFTRIGPEDLFHLQNIIRYNSPDADAIDNEISRHPGVK